MRLLMKNFNSLIICILLSLTSQVWAKPNSDVTLEDFFKIEGIYSLETKYNFPLKDGTIGSEKSDLDKLIIYYSTTTNEISGAITNSKLAQPLIYFSKLTAYYSDSNHPSEIILEGIGEGNGKKLIIR